MLQHPTQRRETHITPRTFEHQRLMRRRSRMLFRLLQTVKPLPAFDAFPDSLVVGIDGEVSVPVLGAEVFAPAESDVAV